MMRGQTGAPVDAVVAERARFRYRRLGRRRLLARQAARHWGESGYTRFIATPDGKALYGTDAVGEMDLDPASARARRAVARVRDHITFYEGNQPFFAGWSRPASTAAMLNVGADVGEPWILCWRGCWASKLHDNGWNCAAPPSVRSSFNSTIACWRGSSGRWVGARRYARGHGGPRPRQGLIPGRRMPRGLPSGEMI